MASDATFLTMRESGSAASDHRPLAELGYAVCRPVRHWLRWRRTVAALSRLDTHMLRDVGVPAGEIEAVARKAVSERLPARPGLGAALERTIADWRLARQARPRTRVTCGRGEVAHLDRLLRDVGLDRGIIGVISIGLEEMAAAEMPMSAARPGYRLDAPAVASQALGVKAATANENMLRRAS